MALNREKYDIAVRNDDAIKRNQIIFDFMQQTLNHMDGLYLHEGYLLTYTTMKYQLREQSAAKIEKLDREKKCQKQNKGSYI